MKTTVEFEEFVWGPNEYLSLVHVHVETKAGLFEVCDQRRRVLLVRIAGGDYLQASVFLQALSIHSHVALYIQQTLD